MTSNFAIVDLEQGTSEWLAWRHRGIGASEAATVMGENRFESSSELLQKKRGPVVLDSFQNDAMVLGTQLEPEARELYISTTGNQVKPACVQSLTFEWFKASLDGISTNHDTVVEIKCGASVYRRVAETHTIPAYYYGQLQHILSITGLDNLDFWCYWPYNSPVLLTVERNESYIERLMRKEAEFWELVTQGYSEET